MYDAFYGLREKPFNVGPDPRYLYLSASHRDAIAYLSYAIRERAGFAVLVGEVGVGKTTVVRAVAADLAEVAHVAFVLTSKLSFKQLLALALHDLGLVTRGRDKGDLLIALQDWLVTETARGRTTAIVVDEAQNLTPPVLEDLRMLSNLEADGAKLVQIVLVGQPELLGVLNLRELRQLRQRIPGLATIRPLPSGEVAEYVRFRLAVAGGAASLFDEEALSEIAMRSAGIPRVVNLVCERALVFAYAEGAHTVTRAIACEAARDLASAMDSWLVGAPAEGVA